jgi:hypothetical protein
MLSGTCPKCGSDEIFANSDGGYRRMLKNKWRLGYVQIVTYCCAYCGYVEDYVQEKDRSEIAKYWKRVAPEGKHKRDMDS